MVVFAVPFPTGLGAGDGGGNHDARPIADRLARSVDSQLLGAAVPAIHPTKVPGCSRSRSPIGLVDFLVYPNLTTYSHPANEVESFVDIHAFATANHTTLCIDRSAKFRMSFPSSWVAKDVVVHGPPKVRCLQDIPEVAYDANCSAPYVSKSFSVAWYDDVWNFTSKGDCNPSTIFDCMNPGDFVGNLTGGCSHPDWKGDPTGREDAIPRGSLD